MSSASIWDQSVKWNPPRRGARAGAIIMDGRRRVKVGVTSESSLLGDHVWIGDYTGIHGVVRPPR